MIRPSPPPVHFLLTDVAGLAMYAVVLGTNHGEDARNFVLVPGLGLSGNYMMPTAE